MSNPGQINKDPTSDRERDRDGEFEIAGNVRESGQDPSPGDRDRGERSDAEHDDPTDTRGR